MNEIIAIIILGIFVVIFIMIECFTIYYAYNTYKLLGSNGNISLSGGDIALPYNWMKVYTVPISAASNQYMLALSIMSIYDVYGFTNDVKNNKVSYIILMGTVYGVQYYMSDNFHVMFWVNLLREGTCISNGIPYLKPVMSPRVVQLLGYAI